MKYKDKLKFSIIVVSLNTKKLFLKTINSILKQKYKNFEIIVVDGESIDGTQKIIFKKKKYFSKYLIEKDKGIYHAMNKGLILSRGEWIIFMNSGDIFFNKHVLENIAKKEFSKFTIVFGDTLIDHKFIKVYQKGNYFHKNTVTMPFCHQSTLVKSKYLKKNKFNLNYQLSSDFNLFLNSYSQKIKFIRYNGPISKVEALGQSDVKRQKVFNENIKIFFIRKFYVKIVFLIYFKIIEFLKTLVKFCIPHKIVKYVLKIKYYKFN